MFRIGEFSRIARVSGRLLRYYDSIGLFGPQHTDPATGYRYYTAAQLGLLNRILALKDLGLTLDQIARLVSERVSTQEIRGMLTLKKTELERALSEDASRLRHIESRLRQIDEDGALKDYDVVVKSAEAQSYLSLRETFPSMNERSRSAHGGGACRHPQVPAGARDALVVVAHSDFEDDSLDLEIGVGLTRGVRKAVAPSRWPQADAGRAARRRQARDHCARCQELQLRQPPRIRGARRVDGSQRLPDQRPEPRGVPRHAAVWSRAGAVIEIQFPVTDAS